MSSEQPHPSRFAEDLQFREKPGGPARYQDWTEKPVRYFTVVDKDDNSILGYLWASDEDDAAAYEPRKAGGPRAVNAGMPWIIRLREGKARGLRPTQTLVELYGDAQPAGRGRPLQGSLTDAPNAAAVETLAQVSNEEPTTSRFREDLQFRQVAGPATYSVDTVGPVVYLSVADRTGTVIGYVWANDEDDAAGWIVPPGLSANAVNAGGRWVRALRAGKARQLAPTALLAEMARGANDSEQSHAVPGSLTEAPTLAALKKRASGG